MSFQEKNIAVSLVNFSLILVYLLIRLLQMAASETFTESNDFRLWIITIIAAIVVTVAATIFTHIVSAIIEAIKTGEKEPKLEKTADERDKLIDLRGTSLAYSVSSGGALIAMLTFVFGQPPLVMFTLLIFFGLVAQIVGDATRLLLYRRGF
ncbi:MAG: hypothetical protein H6654_00845 [Ardenticatenaceae bacterium]|nr:hypothetical protein [Anaerolineales bacterium]MCB8940733.1 hypothetical protein [Ardenticatenaceae bacterium]MCB8972072.1 hypothetical protein [Ardenticatenaceae bacterium]